MVGLGIADGGSAAELSGRRSHRRGPETPVPLARLLVHASRLILIGAAADVRGRLLSRAVGRVAQRLIDAAPARALVGGRGGVGPAFGGIHLIRDRGADAGAARLPARGPRGNAASGNSAARRRPRGRPAEPESRRGGQDFGFAAPIANSTEEV